MNYIDQINYFWQLQAEQPFQANETQLYFYLLHSCNKLFWKQPFGHSDRYLADKLNISPTTLRKAKKTLAERGLISYSVPDKIKTQCKYRIKSVSKTDTDKTTSVSNTDSELYQKLVQPVSETDTDMSKSVSKTGNNNKTITKLIENSLSVNEETYDLQIFYETLKRKISNYPLFSKKTVSIKVCETFLKSYLPSEILNVLKSIQNRSCDFRETCERLELSEILELYLPQQRNKVEKYFDKHLCYCPELKKMPKQLTLREKIELYGRFSEKSISQAIEIVEDRPDYRKGQSVYMALKTNLEKTENKTQGQNAYSPHQPAPR